MIDSNVARRYARALLDLAGGDNARLQETSTQLTTVSSMIAKSGSGSEFLLSPGAPKAQQHSMVEALSPKLEKPVADLLRLLIDRNRFDGLPQIAASFATLVDEKLGRVRATVTSAAPLGPGELEKIGAQLSKATGKQISLDARTDPALLGGLQADVGGVLFDGSLRTQLEKLRQELKGKTA